MAAATGMFVVVGCVVTQMPTSNSGIWADPRVQKLIMKQEAHGDTHSNSKLAPGASLLIEDGSDVYFGSGSFLAQQRSTVMVERQPPFDRLGAICSPPPLCCACSQAC